MSTSLKLREVSNQSELKNWVHFAFKHYAHVPRYVPQIIADEMEFFSHKNPVFKKAQIKLFYVEKNSQVLGRICASVLDLETQKLGHKRGRFGWIEFVEDYSVCQMLLDAARNFFSSQNCQEMLGPLGFSDFDPEGLLIEGFEEEATIAASYHLPYYQAFLEKYGLQKEVDYLEFRVHIKPELPKFLRFADERAAKMGKYAVRALKSKQEVLEFSKTFWKALELSFENLFGVVPMSQEQKDFYQKKYFSFLVPSYIHVAYEKESSEIVGFFLAMPNLSRGFQKARGKLFPLGFLHILKDLIKPKAVDFLLAGVIPGHPSPILTAMMACSVYRDLLKKKIYWIETNHELESNKAVTQLWSHFEARQHRKARVFRLNLPTQV